MTFWARIRGWLGVAPEPPTPVTDAVLAEVVPLPVPLDLHIESLRPYRRKRVPSEGLYATAAATSAFQAMQIVYDRRLSAVRAEEER